MRSIPGTRQHTSAMAFKVVALLAFVAVASAQVLKADPEYDPNPSYEYSYSVNDPLTGDSKSASESRQGDNVQGSYSLVDADGSVRNVQYTADAVNGFNAVVTKDGVVTKNSPVAAAPAVAYQAAPAVAYHAAPVAAYHAAPVAAYHAAPVTAYHAAPVAAYHAAPVAAYHAAPVAAYHAAPVAVAHSAAPAYLSSSFSSPYATYAY